MRVDPYLTLRQFRAMCPQVPEAVRVAVLATWVSGHTLEARRIMASAGMGYRAIGAVVARLGRTLIPD